MEPVVLSPTPPTRHLLNEEWINEYETVDWYTSLGKRYIGEYCGRRWFKRQWEKRLLKSIEINHQVVKETE